MSPLSRVKGVREVLLILNQFRFAALVVAWLVFREFITASATCLTADSLNEATVILSEMF